MDQLSRKFDSMSAGNDEVDAGGNEDSKTRANDADSGEDWDWPGNGISMVVKCRDVPLRASDMTPDPFANIPLSVLEDKAKEVIMNKVKNRLMCQAYQYQRDKNPTAEEFVEHFKKLLDETWSYRDALNKIYDNTLPENKGVIPGEYFK